MLLHVIVMVRALHTSFIANLIESFASYTLCDVFDQHTDAAWTVETLTYSETTSMYELATIFAHVPWPTFDGHASMALFRSESSSCSSEPASGTIDWCKDVRRPALKRRVSSCTSMTLNKRQHGRALTDTMRMHFSGKDLQELGQILGSLPE